MLPDKLFNRNYILLCFCNLFFELSFFIILPVLPLYLTGELGASKSMAGVIVSLYAIAALVIRPFSGAIVDAFQRKPVLVLTTLVYAVVSAGYLFTCELAIFGLIRLAHGLFFSVSGTSLNTVVVENIPKSKLGTGIGLFGVITSSSMALAPMFGIAIMTHSSARMAFVASLICGVLALVTTLFVSAPKREIPKRTSVALKMDDMILHGSLGIALIAVLSIFPYGLLSNYVSLLAQERGMENSAGIFFLFLASGMVLSRAFSGHLLDKGLLRQVIAGGQGIVVIGFIWFITGSGLFHFLGSGMLLGLGFGLLMPAFQTYLIRIADKDHVGTANSTYYLAMDMAIGGAMLSGGILADLTSLSTVFVIAAILMAFALLSFLRMRKF